jgi:Tfp pilus assembly protein PilF
MVSQNHARAGATNIMPSDREEQARQQFVEAYQAQMSGDLDRAVKLYQKSIDLYPTAEAHTFLGWTYHFQGKIEKAIEECKRAIVVDPDFGNPYNDIGAYLIDLRRLDEAIPWLEQAITAKRYEPRHFPYYNLGRIYLFKGHINRARTLFQKALEIEPRYLTARQAIDKLRHMVN